ncbi:nuclear transport factor 2 family protein [Mesorhizobium sp. M0317]|uniref:nuclear transport factor 2 family protein n=1 Tax=Mesorhizobium sp. M0317 TaxID=2956935 RepID=UPI00333708A5
MSERWKGLITVCAILRYFALAYGFCFAFSGTALADSCGTEATHGWNVNNNPPAEDRQAIQDLLSRYAWTIDEKNAAAFATLFAEPKSSYYEICDAGSSVLELTLDLGPESAHDLLVQMKIIVKKLETDKLQTRHLVTNTLFDVVDDKTVNTKSIVLVTMQDSHASAPSLDYSADARASVVKGDDGMWRFQSLTVHADYDAGSVAAKKR